MGDLRSEKSLGHQVHQRAGVAELRFRPAGEQLGPGAHLEPIQGRVADRRDPALARIRI